MILSVNLKESCDIALIFVFFSIVGSCGLVLMCLNECFHHSMLERKWSELLCSWSEERNAPVFGIWSEERNAPLFD